MSKAPAMLRVEKTGSKYVLFADFVKVNFPCSHSLSKKEMTMYLNKNYGIDLRTDTGIQKNYIEMKTKLISTKEANKTYVKSPL